MTTVKPKPATKDKSQRPERPGKKLYTHRVPSSFEIQSGEIRKVELDEYVREFSERFREGIVPDADTAQFIDEISSHLGWPEVTFGRNEKDPEPPRYANPEAEAQAILTAHDSACACLGLLRALAADGDEDALSEFVQQLADNVAWLEGYSYRDKGNLKALATDANAWPVMLNRRPRKLREAAEYLERIGLARNLIQPATSRNRRAPPKLKTKSRPGVAKLKNKARMICDTSYSAGRWLGDLRLQVGGGNRSATLRYVALLLENVAWLESYSVGGRGNMKAIASFAPVWPVLMASCSRRIKTADEYLKRIELGTKAQISSSPKWGTSWGNEGAVATHYARAIRLAVGNARTFFLSYDGKLETNGPLSRAAWHRIPQWIKDVGRLPPLTKESTPRWFEIGWQLLVEEHNGHPESDPTLRKLCNDSRANKYARRYPKIAGPFSSKEILNRKESPPATAAADRRSRIKERILDALISLAPSQ